MHLTSRAAAIPAGLFLLAFGLRVAAGYLQYPNIFQVGDITYLTIAERLVNFGSYELSPGQPTAFRPPIYPLYLAAWYALLGRIPEMAIFGNSLVNAAVVLAVYFLAKSIYGARTAVLAGGGVALYPYLIWQSSGVMETGLLSLTLLTFIAAVHHFLRRGGLTSAAAVGLMAGVTMLTKSTTGPFLALMVTWCVIAAVRTRKDLRLPLVMIAAAALITFPYYVRNYRAFGEVVLTETMAGDNLWKGNNAKTFDIYPISSLDSIAPYQYALEPADLRGEPRINRWWMSLALTTIAADPAKFVQDLAYKAALLYHFDFVPNLPQKAVVDAQTGAVLSRGPARPLAERVLYTLPYLLLMAFALPGAVLSWRRDRTITVMFLALIVLWTLLHAAVFTYTRYRMTLEPFFAMWAGYAASALLGRLRRETAGPVINTAAAPEYAPPMLR